MIRALLVSFLLLACATAKAQYPINDTAFASVLQNIVPNAMTGNVLDETHPDVLNLTVMEAWHGYIEDLDGVQLFTGLTELWCEGNKINSIPSLPPALEWLVCHQNELTTLPTLPATLNYIVANDNEFTSLPTLPAGLEHLNVSWNYNIVLPALPTGLRYLSAHYCELYTLPALPSGLEHLGCGWNNLTTLPTLPSSLLELYCTGNDLQSLPALPSSVYDIFCDHNQLTSLPTLPNSISWLIADHNQLTSLPALPPSLSQLTVNSNQISSLPPLPSNLQHMEIRNNQLQAMPALPSGIKFLHCDTNQLSVLPALPASLDHLYCNNNQLTALPAIEHGLKRLRIENNPIDCLPWLPNSMQRIYCNGTAISCLPNIPTNLTVNNCALSVCNINSAPCPIMDEAVSGIVFHDDNGDGILDAGEPGFMNAIVEAQPGSYLTIPDTAGNYVLPLDTGSFILDGQDVLYHIRTTSPHNISLGLLEVDTLKHIGYQAIPGIYDLVVDVSSGPVRPGFNNAVWLNIENIGTETTTATIDFTFDLDQTWVSSDSIPDAQVGNMASWSKILDPGESWQNRVILNTDVAIPLGTPIQYILSAIPQLPDTTPVNNSDTLNKVVVGSYDPNNKLNEPSTMLPLQVANGEYIEYTINFQNTGTYHAERVVITDTLSPDLDWSSMDYISGSHDNTWFLQNGVLHFVHDPIFLPDSNSNEPESHGFVKFRMKPVSTLMIGEQIENIANIYFDFNEPIITDPALFEVAVPTALSEFEDNEFQLYPNPTDGNITVASNTIIRSITLMQSDGRVVYQDAPDRDRLLIDIDHLASGLYILQIDNINDLSSSKLLIKE